MSSDRPTGRIAVTLALGAGVLGVAAPQLARAQDPVVEPVPTTTVPAPAHDGTTTTPGADTTTTPTTTTPVETTPAPVDRAPAPAVSAQTPPASSALVPGPLKARSLAPLDFARDPLPVYVPPPERERVAVPRREATQGRLTTEPQPDVVGDDAAGEDAANGGPGGVDGDRLPAGVSPARIPDFFIGRFGIPPFLLSIYQAAGVQYGVPWQVLAAINEIETDYGRNLDVSSAGAMGWMQFMPASWERYGVDANEDGRKDPYSPVDAIFAAARYLKAAGADRDLRGAVFAYNHAGWYVDAVLERARFVAGLPSDLVDSLTGLTQGRLPVAARMRYTRRVAGGGPRRSLRIDARPGAAVVAVQDGRIVRVGRSARLGRYVMLRDAYGNTYTYASLGRVATNVLVAKERPVVGVRSSQAGSGTPLATPGAAPAPAAGGGASPTSAAVQSMVAAGVDPVPVAAASAGSNAATATAKRAAATGASGASGASGVTAPPAAGASAAATAPVKERLFAHPGRARNLSSGGRRQILDAAFALPASADLRSYFAGDVGLKRSELELKRLLTGRRVIAGTIVGRVGATTSRGVPHMRFAIRPAGRGAPTLDPEPFIEGWRLLQQTAILRARSTGAQAGIGQILLMSKDALARRVLDNPAITLQACGRRDIQAGVIDRRVLATLEFLAANQLRPTVSALRCGHSFYTETGELSQHTTGNGVDISKINGIPMMGNQGPGSITDLTVRRLLTLQGAMAPAQIISLMRYPKVSTALARPDHADHIHIGYRPTTGTSGGRGVAALGLKPSQWLRLVDRLTTITNPKLDRPTATRRP